MSKIREKIEKVMYVTEKMMKPEFVKRFNFFERMILSFFLYIWIGVEMVILLCEAGVRFVIKIARICGVHIAKWYRKCADAISNARKDLLFRALTPAVFALIVVLMLAGLVVYESILHYKRDLHVNAALENVEIEYVVAGKDEGEYYTWWAIAENYCPKYMEVTNWGDCDCNYLALLYSYNGGYHTLQDGELIAVPILK